MAKIVDFGNTYGRFFEKNFRSLKPTRTQQIMRTSPPASGCILPAIPLCKNRGKVETLLRNFLNKLISNIGCHSILRASFFSPISTWRKSSFLETPTAKNVRGFDCIFELETKKAPWQTLPQSLKQKSELGYRPNSPSYKLLSNLELKGFLLPFTPSCMIV